MKRLIALLFSLSLATNSFGAMYFDGTNDSILLGNPSSLDITGAVTVSTWVKITTPTTLQVFLGAYGAGPSFFGYGLGISITTASKISFYTNLGGWKEGTISVPAGTWTHIAASFTGSAVSIYIDGAHDVTTATTGITSNAANKRIGSNTNGTDFEVTGLIEDVRIYRRALSANEIKTLAFSRNRLPCSKDDGCVGYWKLDDGTPGQPAGGVTARDSSGNGNHGTPVNTIWQGSPLSQQ